MRPWIVDQRPGPPGYMYVTYATDRLTRYTLKVPIDVWRNGEHAPLGELTHAVMTSLDPISELERYGGGTREDAAADRED